MVTNDSCNKLTICDAFSNKYWKCNKKCLMGVEGDVGAVAEKHLLNFIWPLYMYIFIFCS